MKLDAVQVTELLSDMNKVEILAKEAFPPEEYLSPQKLLTMAEQGEVDFWALYAGQTFVGFMVVRTYRNMAYLFFLAIDPTLRSRGYGGAAIETLKSLYPDMQQVVDLEMLDDTAENSAQRQRRRRFYLQNGYRATGHYLSYLGVDYEILCMDETFDFLIFQKMLDSLSIEGFCPVYFTRQVEKTGFL